MSRHRWFRAAWPFPLETLADRLRTNSFTAASDEGFILDRLRSDVIEARYVQRLLVDETTTDPFGERLVSQRIQYGETAFVVIRDDPYMEIIDPARSVSRFISKLLEITDFSFVVESVVIPIDVWANELLRVLPGKNFVSSVQLNALEMAPGIRGRLVVTGDIDVREWEPSKAGLIGGRVDKLQITLTGETRGVISLASNAAAKVMARQDAVVVEAVRAALPRVPGHA